MPRLRPNQMLLMQAVRLRVKVPERNPKPVDDARNEISHENTSFSVISSTSDTGDSSGNRKEDGIRPQMRRRNTW
ncbi:uncharacterized protein EAF02_001848 [Botrytis sinoallii]|uniref:uncharacterized protein n=1 Tax=Botrytis sinoallii TaxID=1463999 RepID=UPI0019000ED5|nr:uncharacterized protein EAF02_001848 [Botrytis sinoallii]KAF7891523.1 hypothetical protein EAF02_001848 [Botrytis sinoallii]